eukprot:SAG31_NODE_7467_length_1681_cov_8.587863_1_plen_72_part_00
MNTRPGGATLRHAAVAVVLFVAAVGSVAVAGSVDAAVGLNKTVRRSAKNACRGMCDTVTVIFSKRRKISAI